MPKHHNKLYSQTHTSSQPSNASNASNRKYRNQSYRQKQTGIKGRVVTNYNFQLREKHIFGGRKKESLQVRFYFINLIGTIFVS